MEKLRENLQRLDSFRLGGEEGLAGFDERRGAVEIPAAGPWVNGDKPEADGEYLVEYLDHPNALPLLGGGTYKNGRWSYGLNRPGRVRRHARIPKS